MLNRPAAGSVGPRGNFEDADNEAGTPIAQAGWFNDEAGRRSGAPGARTFADQEGEAHLPSIDWGAL